MATQYDLTVVSNQSITPHMRRVLLCGDSLENFPADQESGYVKVLFPQQEGPTRVRSFTIRSFDVSKRVLALDFVDHSTNGLASAWANGCQTGDAVSIRGPGERKLADPAADWYLLAGDMSALPALAVNLEQLPADARGYCVIEVASERDRQLLDHPPGVELIWVMSPAGAPPNSALVKTVRGLEWLPGTPYPWFAGEFDAMREMRSYFRDERAINRKAMYVSSYWKAGATNEGMKKAKRVDVATDTIPGFMLRVGASA